MTLSHSSSSPNVQHLPAPIRPGDRFVKLYRSQPTGCQAVARRRRSIPQGLSMEETYRRLPQDDLVAFSGYVTRSRIHYSEYPPRFQDRRCAFYTRPRTQPQADAPTVWDVYHFLKDRVRRRIIVGRDWIWWWDKDAGVLPAVRRLLNWEAVHMVPTMRECFAAAGCDGPNRYVERVMGLFGISDWELATDLAGWAELLEERLGLETQYCFAASID